MKAIIPALLILGLVASHKEVTKDVNLVIGKDTYNIVHDCEESDDDDDDLSNIVIAKNDVFDPYAIILNRKYDGNCYYLVTCDLCCRSYFYKTGSDEGSTEVEIAVTDGKKYHESISIKIKWDPELIEEVSDEDCL